MTDLLHNLLTIKNLSLGYIPGEYLVESGNALAQEGEMIALVGRNGAGKSTLLRTIAGIQKTEQGAVLLNGKSFQEYESRDLASFISFVGTWKSFGENMTVYEMVSLGRHPYTNWWGALKERDRRKILESIQFVGMSDFVNSRVELLSDGERQRVMIAMALAQDTKIVILDEPTAFLDIPNRIGISEVLHKLKMANRLVIFSTHDFDNVFTYADKVWLIHDKKLIEGAPEDLGIQNIFDEIFSESLVDFDQSGLRFIRKKQEGKQVFLKSAVNEPNTYWTKRALERLGYTVESTGNSPHYTVIVKQNGETIEWILKNKNTSSVFYSLYDMSRYLTREG